MLEHELDCVLVRVCVGACVYGYLCISLSVCVSAKLSFESDSLKQVIVTMDCVCVHA